MLIQCGDSEVLRDEITLLAHKATCAGVPVTHEIFVDMVHVFQMFTFLPASKAAIQSVGRWVREILPKIEEEHSMQTPIANLGMADRIEAERHPGSTIVTEEGETIHSTPQSRFQPSSLRLNLNAEQPSIDMDSLPSSSSGSATPTLESTDTLPPIDLIDSGASRTPLRRAQSTITPHHSPRLRRRAGTSTVSNSSNPASPTGSIRRKLRSPTPVTQTVPSTRARSQSHSDIFELVEGYVEGGAANETVVYAPGGEIRSVGILGEEDSDE